MTNEATEATTEATEATRPAGDVLGHLMDDEPELTARLSEPLTGAAMPQLFTEDEWDRIDALVYSYHPDSDAAALRDFWSPHDDDNCVAGHDVPDQACIIVADFGDPEDSAGGTADATPVPSAESTPDGA